MKTRSPGILTLSGVPVLKAEEVVTHYQIYPEMGWLPAANITTLSPWSLGELGFVTLDKKPESFDLIDGKKPPNNVVKGILGQMYKAAKADPRTGSALNQYNYERLLKQIDKNNDSQFSEEEYLQAIQLPAYRDHLYRIIAKHPSEWWYGKDDPLWKTYLDTLTEDASTWKTYLETFIERLTWMKSVAGMGPDPWHMHPVVFLEALKKKNDWFNIERFVEIYMERHSEKFGFYNKGQKVKIPSLNKESEVSLRSLLNEMKSQYYKYYDSFNEKFISYMLSTVRIESYDFMRGVYFKPINEHISSQEAEKNYGSGPLARDARTARLNHNTNAGDGYKYRGRGLVQLTWKINYERFMRITGVDIVTNPDLCLDASIAVTIMMKGMRDGDFRTGNTLDKYLGENRRDYFNARLIINGYHRGIPDRANEFEDFANLFEEIINETF